MYWRALTTGANHHSFKRLTPEVARHHQFRKTRHSWFDSRRLQSSGVSSSDLECSAVLRSLQSLRPFFRSIYFSVALQMSLVQSEPSMNRSVVRGPTYLMSRPTTASSPSKKTTPGATTTSSSMQTG